MTAFNRAPSNGANTTGYTIAGSIYSLNYGNAMLYLPDARALVMDDASKATVNGMTALGNIENCTVFGVAIVNQRCVRLG